MSDGGGSARTALRIFAWSRLAQLLLAATVVLAFESSLDPQRAEWDSERLHELGDALDVWARWDSDWYLRVAEHGYSWPSSTPAFFPLYPLLVAGLGRALLGHYLLAGIVVSLAAAAAAFVLLHRLALPRLGPGGARRAVLYLAVFPTSLFLGAVYGESLFLLLALATFALAERGRLGWAAVATGLAMLARPVGAAVLAALLVYAWQAPARWRALGTAAVAPALFALYPLVLWIWIGQPLAFLDAQEAVWERRLSRGGPLGGLWDGLTRGALLELGLVVALLALCVVAWRRFGAPYGVYGLGVLVLPLSTPSEKLPLYSMTRFGLVVFPALLALAALTAGRQRLHRVLVVASAAWLAVLVVEWALWRWVA